MTQKGAFVFGDHLNEPDCDVLTCDEIEGTYFHLDGGLVSFVEHDDSDHVTVLVRDPRDGTIIDDDTGIDLGDGRFRFAAAGEAWLKDGILHFDKPGSMTEWVKYQDRAMPDTTTTDTTTTTVTATTVTTVEPTKGTAPKPNRPLIKISLPLFSSCLFALKLM